MSRRVVASVVVAAVVAPNAASRAAFAGEPPPRTAIGVGLELTEVFAARLFVAQRVVPALSVGLEGADGGFPSLFFPVGGRRTARVMTLLTFHLLETEWSRGGAAITLETGFGVYAEQVAVVHPDGRTERRGFEPRLLGEIAPGFHLFSGPFSWDVHFGGFVRRDDQGTRTLSNDLEIVPLLLRLGMHVRF